MPRLSDLLSDTLKKKLLAGAAKTSRCKEQSQPNDAAKPKNGPVVRVAEFVAIDVETTGLDFSSDRVIEVGAVKFINGKPGEEFSMLVNPGTAIPPAITDLTGISGADVAAAPRFAEIAPKLLAFLGDLPLCGHQIEFDLTFLNKEFERAGGGQTIGKQSFDTALLSKILLQAESGFSLKAVSETLSVTLENAHRALNDAKASGEVAAALIPKITELPLHIRQTIAAAAPASFFKTLIFQSLGGAHSKVCVKTHRDAHPLPKLAPPEQFRQIDREEVKKIFSENGSLQHHIESYSSRKCQIDMALEVADALNTQSFLVAEAGTGTGKSLAYLIPAAQWGVANGARILIATRTKNLQDQLISKELPLISRLLGPSFRYSLLKGRSNYLCLNRFEKLLLGEYGNLSHRERFAVLPLIPWVESTATGDIEEQNQFNSKWFHKLWDLLSAESYGCVKGRCPFFKECFLQQARQKALSSHIVVINHALFFSETASGNSFLGTIGSIVFDEAHHLESSGHKHLRVELDTNRVSRFLEELNNLVQSIGAFQEASEIYFIGKEIKSHLKQVRKRSQAFLQSIHDWAGKNRQDSRAVAEYQLPFGEADFTDNVEAPAFENTIATLKDQLYRLKQSLTGTPVPAGEGGNIREDTQVCLERASQLSADLRYLVAAKTEDHAFWVEGNLEKGWTKLCGVPLDVAGLLSKLWADCSGSVIFTSATVSIARSVDYFLNSVGLAEHKERTAVGFFPSPFRAHQAIAGAIKSAPEPDDPTFPRFVAGVIGELHASTGRNILVLFTANSMLGEVNRLLRSDSRIGRSRILAQGTGGGRHALLEQFKRNQSMILLGADSFWEGIDAPGEACEIVIIPRLPFPVPTHPLNLAIQRKMEALHGESFMSFSMPEAVIRFRQGAGRLIRTATDRGALIVLDNRIVKKGYGKQFIRSLDWNFTSFEDTHDMGSRVQAFFSGTSEPPATTVSYVPFDEV